MQYNYYSIAQYRNEISPNLLINYHRTCVRQYGSMTYAPTTNAPARNANVEAYINPDPIPNPNPNPNPYPALNQKPNHTHESNSVFGEVSMPEQLSPEHMVVSPTIFPNLAYCSCDRTRRKWWSGGHIVFLLFSVNSFNFMYSSVHGLLYIA